jgi:hypothetical protein
LSLDFLSLDFCLLEQAPRLKSRHAAAGRTYVRESSNTWQVVLNASNIVRGLSPDYGDGAFNCFGLGPAFAGPKLAGGQPSMRVRKDRCRPVGRYSRPLAVRLERHPDQMHVREAIVFALALLARRAVA